MLELTQIFSALFQVTSWVRLHDMSHLWISVCWVTPASLERNLCHCDEVSFWPFLESGWKFLKIYLCLMCMGCTCAMTNGGRTTQGWIQLFQYVGGWMGMSPGWATNLYPLSHPTSPCKYLVGHFYSHVKSVYNSHVCFQLWQLNNTGFLKSLEMFLLSCSMEEFEKCWSWVPSELIWA